MADREAEAEHSGAMAARGTSVPPEPSSAPVVAGSDPQPRGRRRAPPMAREARRRTILEAALAEFTTHGFAQTKLDQVARRAGVAKGTLYLYFTDKEALFHALVEENITSVLTDADVMVARFSGPTCELLDRLMGLMADRVLEGPAAPLVRLMMSEGPRFPDLAAFYHRQVVSRGIALIRQVAQRGLDRGEFSSDLAVRFPQLVVAPAILAVVWNSLFSGLDPLDTRALLAAHRDLLLKGLGRSEA